MDISTTTVYTLIVSDSELETIRVALGHLVTTRDAAFTVDRKDHAQELVEQIDKLDRS